MKQLQKTQPAIEMEELRSATSKDGDRPKHLGDAIPTLQEPEDDYVATPVSRSSSVSGRGSTSGTRVNRNNPYVTSSFRRWKKEKTETMKRQHDRYINTFIKAASNIDVLAFKAIN